jgi:tetratricopeptide (TPR) repeat protein
MALYGEIPAGPEEKRLLKRSAESYEKAHRLAPDDDAAPYNAAAAYQKLAGHEDSPEAKRKWLETALRYREIAARLDPADAGSFSGWGTTLAKLAHAPSPAGASFDASERVRLLTLAGQKFRTATELDPSSAFAWQGWALTLLDRAEDHFDMAGRGQLLERARSRIARAIALDSAEGYFLLGRLEVRLNRVEEAVEALVQWRRLNPHAALARIRGCSDFDEAEGNPAFRELMESWD